MVYKPYMLNDGIRNLRIINDNTFGNSQYIYDHRTTYVGRLPAGLSTHVVTGICADQRFCQKIVHVECNVTNERLVDQTIKKRSSIFLTKTLIIASTRIRAHKFHDQIDSLDKIHNTFVVPYIGQHHANHYSNFIFS